MKLLSVHDLVFTYDRRRVVDKVSFDVDRGQIVGLLGPNGAGKTTTFGMAVGMLHPKSGTITFKGQEITRLPMYKRARLGMSYLSQEPSIFRKLTVEQNVLAILETLPLKRNARRDRLRDLLSWLKLSNLARNLAETLSGGERRRLEITRALVTQPLLMLLDEPFAGIDPIHVAEVQDIVKTLRERGIGVLLTDHNVRETLSITDRAYIINEGRILAHGSSAELVRDPKVRKFYLGERFDLPASLFGREETTVEETPQPAAGAAPGVRESGITQDEGQILHGPLYRDVREKLAGEVPRRKPGERKRE